MKVRTDFVTNSSSSSFITITIKMKNGSKIISKNSMDDIGHGYDPDAIALMEDEDILKMLEPVSNGEDLIKVLDDHFLGMFKVYPLTEDQRKSSLGSILEKMVEDANYEALKQITDFSEVDKITINDNWSGDYGKKKKTFVYDPNRRKGKSR